jgi:hypothetical protein
LNPQNARICLKISEDRLSLAALGVIQGTAEVAVDSDDALALSDALPSLFPGEHASIESLRGYGTGLALMYGLRGGTSAQAIAARLIRPARSPTRSPFRGSAPHPPWGRSASA